MGGQGIGSKGVKRSSDRIKRCQKGTWRGSTGDLRGPRGTCGGPGGSKEVKGVLEGEWVHIEMIWCDCAMITQWFSKWWHEIPWWWWLTKLILWPRSYSLSWSKKSWIEYIKIRNNFILNIHLQNQIANGPGKIQVDHALNASADDKVSLIFHSWSMWYLIFEICFNRSQWKLTKNWNRMGTLKSPRLRLLR